MHNLRLFFSITLLQVGLGTVAADSPAENTNRFYSPTHGFTVLKPTTWQFASTEWVAASRSTVQLKDKEVEEHLRRRAKPPLVVIAKHAESYRDLNPSVQVAVIPIGKLGDKSAVELMRLFLPNAERAVADFGFVEQIQKTVIDGMPAAYAKGKYMATNSEGREFKTLLRVWIVPHGSSMFVISASGPQEGPDLSETEFNAILNSIKIEK
jgi:hypothetical protein